MGAAGAQVKVVYFQNGRQETWRGPAGFSCGTEHSASLLGTVFEVTNLPVGVPQNDALGCDKVSRKGAGSGLNYKVVLAKERTI